MSQTKMILGLGVLIAVMPYLGFPSFLKNLIFTVLGIIIATLGYLLERKEKEGMAKEVFENFSENGAHHSEYLETTINNE